MLRWATRLYLLVILLGSGPLIGLAFGRSAWLGAALLLAVGAQWLAAAVVLALRWVNPGRTAFMRRAQRQHGGRVDYQWAPEAALSPELRLAAIAGEDVYFALHSGFDWESLRAARAYNVTVSGDAPRRGGSTISQQVAKNLFLWPQQSYVRKALEAYLTLFVEAAWPKHRILEVYLNVVQFGPLTFGAEAAAQRFFNKPAAALTANEAALLITVLPSPNHWRVDQPDRAMRYRQLLIVGSMRKLGPGYLVRLEGGRA